MGLAFPFFTDRLFSPPGALPVLCRPNRRWARGAARTELLRLKVAEVIVETPSTRTFVLDGGALRYAAGQHVTLVAELDGRTQRRCYSFSSSPAAGDRPSITVKRVEGGVMSNWLHDHVRSGDVLRALPASGRFTIDTDPNASRHVVMVAGGVGITPIISMTETLLREERHSRVTVLYGSRCEREIIFRERLEAMQRAFGPRVDVVFAVDEAPAAWTGLQGTLAGERVVSLTRDLAVDAWYICGPQPMMDGAVAALAGAGVESGRVHLERFQYAEPGAVALPTGPATLVFAASGTSAAARSGATILEAAEQAGIALPSSCRMGGCGACKVKVDGRIVAAEPNCLSEQERSEGYALACCSYADGRVTLRDF